MSAVISIVTRLRHNVLLSFSPGYRQMHARLKQIGERPH
jgi:hypothetical protein